MKKKRLILPSPRIKEIPGSERLPWYGVHRPEIEALRRPIVESPAGLNDDLILVEMPAL